MAPLVVQYSATAVSTGSITFGSIGPRTQSQTTPSFKRVLFPEGVSQHVTYATVTIFVKFRPHRTDHAVSATSMLIWHRCGPVCDSAITNKAVGVYTVHTKWSTGSSASSETGYTASRSPLRTAAFAVSVAPHRLHSQATVTGLPSCMPAES